MMLSATAERRTHNVKCEIVKCEIVKCEIAMHYDFSSRSFVVGLFMLSLLAFL